MKTIKIHAKMKSDFVVFKKITDEGVEVKELLRPDFWLWLQEITNKYDKIALVMENDELLVIR